MKVVDVEKRRETINEHGKEAKGRRELLRHLDGERNTIRQMVLAKCYDCMGYFSDGKDDCGIELCPLYPIMAYRAGEKYTTKTLSPEHREKLSRSRANIKSAAAHIA